MSGPVNALHCNRCECLVLVLAMVACEPAKGHIALPGELLNRVTENILNLTGLEVKALNCRFPQAIGSVYPASDFPTAVAQHDCARLTSNREWQSCKIGRR